MRRLKPGVPCFYPGQYQGPHFLSWTTGIRRPDRRASRPTTCRDRAPRNDPVSRQGALILPDRIHRIAVTEDRRSQSGHDHCLFLIVQRAEFFRGTALDPGLITAEHPAIHDEVDLRRGGDFSFVQLSSWIVLVRSYAAARAWYLVAGMVTASGGRSSIDQPAKLNQ